MHRSSETIGKIAVALAQAQRQLQNPERTLTATITSPFPRADEDVRFRYASLATGLDIVRKALGEQEIATIQSTSFDKEDSLIRPAAHVLAHSSGGLDRICLAGLSASHVAAPAWLGAALTYARRYALFTLAGIAGEDDLDGARPAHRARTGKEMTSAGLAAARSARGLGRGN